MTTIPPAADSQLLWQKAWHGLLDLVFPPHCVACDRIGAWICPTCLQMLPDQPILAADAWWGDRGHLTTLRSLSLHEFPLREAVHGLKYGGMRVLAQPLAEILARRWENISPTIDMVVPIPLHGARRRRRGYNQARLLASAFCQRSGLPLADGVVIRQRNTPSQVGRSRAERQRNMRGAFRCIDDALRGKSLLLIDDVCTTGATLDACAQALLQGGANQVHAFTLTRAP